MKRFIQWMMMLSFWLPSFYATAQSVSITTSGANYSEDFNTLVNTGTSSTLPSGWYFLETGTSANTTYTAGTGSANTGDTYSFGASATTERALGSVLSGSLTSIFGASYTNNTGSTITSITISYTGEQWRLGTASRQDRLDFQYSLDATSLSTGSWTDVDNLDFSSPFTTTVGALDGNATANQSIISFTISGLSIANGSTFWIRWNDFNASGADDGLSIDDFTLNATASGGGGDVTPPVFDATYPKTASLAYNSVKLLSKLDEAGKTYYVVLPAASAAPSTAQIKAGQDATGAAVTLKGNIVHINANEVNTTIANLTSSTAYKIYVVAEDNSNNLQSSASVLDITTPVTPPIYTENFNTCNGDASSFNTYSVSGTDVWACSTFGNGSSNGIQINGGFSGGSRLNEDWLISAKMNLQTSAVMSFFSSRSFQGPAITVKISTNYTGAGDPNLATWTDITSNFTLPTNTTSSASWTASGDFTLSAYDNQAVYVAFVYTSNGAANGGARWTIDDFKVTGASPLYIITSSTFLRDFGYVKSPNTSTIRSYTVTAKGLTADLVVTAPTNVEVSKSSTTGFANSISFTTAEMASTQTVYARFKPAAGSGTLTGNISNVSTGITRNVSVSGIEGISPKDNQLDIVTFNMEWFAVKGFGITDKELQKQNLKAVIESVDADIYCLQEIGDENKLFTNFVNNDLKAMGYSAVRVSHVSTNGFADSSLQARAYVYKTATVSNVTTKLLQANNTTAQWADGRAPALLTADVNINGVKSKINIVNIHAKSGSTTDDYTRRLAGSKVLKTELDSNYATANLIFVGDYNDDLDTSIVANTPSPYKNFVIDKVRYNALSKAALSDKGVNTTYDYSDAIDHIIVSDEMTPGYISNTLQRVDVTKLVNNSSTALSDHYPITASFDLSKLASSTGTGTGTGGIVITGIAPAIIPGIQLYPNPASNVLHIESLPQGRIQARISNLSGQVFYSGELESNGSWQLNIQTLQSGLYILEIKGQDTHWSARFVKE